MKHTKQNLLALALTLVVLLAACTPENPVPTDPTDTSTPAENDRIAYVLNEGVWSGNNAEISRINLTQQSIDPEWFSRVNGRGLGDVAQDLIHYGSRLYCTVWNSNVLEVIDATTGQSIKQISFAERGPRFMVGHEGKVYVSCYDRSVVRIDTVSLEIEASCPLSGMQPEQMCLCGNNLVVCNSWEYASNGTTTLYDSTVSVVSLATFQEVDRITVGTNPTRIQSINSDACIVNCSGDYVNEPASAKYLVISSRHAEPLMQPATAMDYYDGNLYHYITTYDAEWNPTALFYRTDLFNRTSNPILTETSIPHAYGINIDPVNGNILVCNSPYTSTGDIHCYSLDGVLCWKLEAGNLPSKVVF